MSIAKMKYFKIYLITLNLLVTTISWAQSTSLDWSPQVRIPENGRANILNLPNDQWLEYQRAGKIHAQIYPVSVTGFLPPYKATRNLIEAHSSNPLKEFINKIVRNFNGIKTFDGLLKRVGLQEYPPSTEEGIYHVPYPNNEKPNFRMGFGLVERSGTEGFTMSCAACHAGKLFGKTVLGMTNRFPRANDFFVKTKSFSKFYNSWVFEHWTGANKAEMIIMNDSMRNLKRVAAKQPLVLGLDTSLAQVSLSLNRRSPDEFATPSAKYENKPRPDAFLDRYPADSKPAVWWNVKYKNKWLSDGSVISGNPIFTNIIWNEIGRGVDLRVLESWLAQNQKIVDELAAMVFASEAPPITDFFPADKIDLGRAKSGELTFNESCARCHGTYVKAWNLPEADLLTPQEKIKTIKVVPIPNTPVKDVGTDSYRRLGMKSLEKLNGLSISRKNNIVIQAQKGYVPPPLVGIWARWPYMHNNSIPNLCALLTAGPKRPSAYYGGEAIEQNEDFDFECNGYPVGSKAPKRWQETAFYYDTHKIGLGNRGHDEGIFLEGGQELLTLQQKKDLIVFLQTL